MIQEVTGDILLSSAAAIAHGVAPNDDFKQGLALALREQWPALYKDFRHYCHVSNPKAGGLWGWKGAGGPIIFNLLTQEPPRNPGDHPGRATIAHVHHALQALAREAEAQRLASLAITRLATGVGGLAWEDVQPQIANTLGGLDLPVYVYATFRKGEKAREA